jgi:hypothetical protein
MKQIGYRYCFLALIDIMQVSISSTLLQSHAYIPPVFIHHTAITRPTSRRTLGLQFDQLGGVDEHFTIRLRWLAPSFVIGGLGP